MGRPSVMRRQYFIDKNFQTRFIIRFCLIVLLASLLIGLLVLFLSRGSTTVTIEHADVLVRKTTDFVFPILVQTLIIATIFSALSVVILTLLTSHKIAGPLYRLKREVDLMREGDLTPDFRIRKMDQLQNLAEALRDLAASLRKRHQALKDGVLRLEAAIEAPGTDRNELDARLRELKDILNRFKI